jgi:outer membrane protein insertion porin family
VARAAPWGYCARRLGIEACGACLERGFIGEISLLIRIRAALVAAACLLPLLFGTAMAQRAGVSQTGEGQAARGQQFAQINSGGTIQSIRIEGNQRIEGGTIRSYMLVAPGDPFDQDRIDRSLKTLYATGLFQDVKLQREGVVLVVRVVENPIVNRVAFEGNHKLSDEQLRPDLELRARSVFTPALAQTDRQHVLDLYARRGRFDATVEPKVIRLAQNRVDVVFEINEGETTLISRIAFVGNHAFSEGRLREVVNSREEAWWRFFSSSDTFDPERLTFDKELLRRFYLHEGYIDIDITNGKAELSPDRKAFFETFTINEGERIRVGKVGIVSHLRKLAADELTDKLLMEEGDWYDGDLVGRTADDIIAELQNRGFAFVDIQPRITRDREKHTVDLTFEIGEGPRVYVERIDITGNVRTEDKVIRREMRLAEGDAFSASAVKLSRQRLNDLQYFGRVDIQNSPGSAPDKAVLNTVIEEKATGELSFGGGYSTDVGALLNVGLRERNLVGTGISAGINGTLAQKSSSVDFSVTDPYFLDRNLVAGFDIFYIVTNNLGTAVYDERRAGIALNMGYAFNEHLRQNWSYSYVNRDVYNIYTGASYYILDQGGTTTLSQVGQTLTLDYRDSRINPHEGSVTRFGTDFAGVGGDARFARTKLDSTYYIPLDRFTGNADWHIAVSAGAGYLFNLGRQEQVIDRFFLGGDNLRGFEAGGVGPHDPVTGDSLGGRFLWTQSTELRYPLPVSADLGLTGRAFVDVGALTQGAFEAGRCPSAPGGVCPTIFQSSAPRVGVGVGVSWQTPLGLINIDLTPFVIKQTHDQTQLFRFGFGTRF